MGIWNLSGRIVLGWIIVSSQAIARDQVIPWPAEARSEARVILNDIRHQNDWSGAHWNPQTQHLWLCRDDAEIRAYRRQGNNRDWALVKRLALPHDCEGITQRDFAEPRVLVLLEREQALHEYEVSGADAQRSARWDISALGHEMEGIAFVPDAVLAQQAFVAGNGEPYPASRFDQGGLVFLAQQGTGKLFALDLRQDAEVEVVGVYDSGLQDPRGLELDRSRGILYAIDRKGFVALRLTAHPSLERMLHSRSPGPKGVEGLALAAGSDDVGFWLLVTDDDNKKQDRAILLYEQFDPAIMPAR